jgi:CubicO group peptidase (beta-lactamase class C family)
LPDNFKPADPGNPYADYSVEQMYEFLGQCKPKREPGAAYEYSNFGMGLLGHVLALRAGKSYEALLSERILQPLKMADTRIVLDDAARARLAQGYDPDNEPVSNWDLPTLAGAGALRSTMTDLLKWAAATADPPKTPLGEAITLARTGREPAGGNDGGPQVGLGWHAWRNGAIVSHSGQTGGYHTYCAVAPGRRLAVVILASNGSPYIDQLGERLSRRLGGEAVEPLALRAVAKLTSDELDAFPGRYVMPLHVLTLTREGDRVYAQLAGQGRLRVYPESPTELFYKAVDARLSFKMNRKTGRAFMVTLKQGAITLPGLRAEGEPTTLPVFYE